MTKVDDILLKLMQDLNIQSTLEEFKMGIEVEKEHTPAGLKEGVYAVIPMKLLPIAKIVAVHLAEFPDYYTRLKNMKIEKKKTTATIKPRNILLNMMGLNSINKILDYFDSPKKEIPVKKNKPESKPEYEYEEIEDDFFASQADEEEAIFPDDIIQKSKQLSMRSTNATKKLQLHELQQIIKLQEHMYETLHYINNKLFPKVKGNLESFKDLKDLRENLKMSLFTIKNILENIK